LAGATPRTASNVASPGPQPLWTFVNIAISRPHGTLRIWSEPFVSLRVPKIFNLRTDPYERTDITSNTYYGVLPHGSIEMHVSTLRFHRSGLRRITPPTMPSADFSAAITGLTTRSVRMPGHGGDLPR
jgi:hypothetical protein